MPNEVYVEIHIRPPITFAVGIAGMPWSLVCWSRSWTVSQAACSVLVCDSVGKRSGPKKIDRTGPGGPFANTSLRLRMCNNSFTFNLVSVVAVSSTLTLSNHIRCPLLALAWRWLADDTFSRCSLSLWHSIRSVLPKFSQAVHNHWSFFHILDFVFEREHRANGHWCLKCHVKLNLFLVSLHQVFQPKSVILALPTHVWELEKSLCWPTVFTLFVRSDNSALLLHEPLQRAFDYWCRIFITRQDCPESLKFSHHTCHWLFSRSFRPRTLWGKFILTRCEAVPIQIHTRESLFPVDCGRICISTYTP